LRPQLLNIHQENHLESPYRKESEKKQKAVGKVDNPYQANTNAKQPDQFLFYQGSYRREKNRYLQIDNGNAEYL
jgi:hypothetical protein